MRGEKCFHVVLHVSKNDVIKFAILPELCKNNDGDNVKCKIITAAQYNRVPNIDKNGDKRVIIIILH